MDSKPPTTMTEQQTYNMAFRDGWSSALSEAAGLARIYPQANRQDLFAEIEKRILALKESSDDN